MASAYRQRKAIRDLIDGLEPSVQQAFLDCVQEITNSIVLGRVISALEVGDIQGALDALNIDGVAFAPLAEALALAYGQGGRLAISLLPVVRDVTGGRALVRWDMRNPRAEQWLREYSSNLITYVSEETKVAARVRIEEGYSRGDGPRTIALSLSGKTDKATGNRTGGLIGMSEPQAQAAENMRTRLLSGDPDEMRKVFAMKTRDKRYDPTIRKAIAEGKPIPPAVAEKMVSRYAAKAIKLRGEVIARTETGTAVMTARAEAVRQAMEAAGMSEEDVTKVWRSAADRRVRHTHAILNGNRVQGFSQPFRSVSGALMRWPMDRGLGAGASEVVSCRCDIDYRFDFTRNLT